MTDLNDTIVAISTPVGEGGIGIVRLSGKKALSIADKVFVLENAYYSVISPEGCAAILWKERSKAPDAAAALKLTAEDLLGLKIIDGIIKEPLGGAHRDRAETAKNIKKTLSESLTELGKLDKKTLVEKRYSKFRKMGVFKDSTE